MLIQGAKVKVGDRLILSDFSLEVRRGLNLVIGPNGAGKTTLLRSVIRALNSLQGMEKGYVPAEFFSSDIPVEDILLSGTRNKLEKYRQYVELLDVGKLFGKRFSTLSTGEKRMVLICKALTEGDLIIMDELTSGLDLKNQRKVLEVINHLKRNKTFLASTHDLQWLGYADYVTLMKSGQIVLQSTPEEVTEDLLEKVYEIKIKRVDFKGRPLFLVDI
ncbi:ABC transporter ATP-binding protein [Metallosphaera tengchongensis]|uniref:ABC transporter ATP-binding protein n=1 Tax=Metallosphaera tengchongensis TaxID=1532350 RepID=A0A6N0NZL9_9CREN|nr:ABC transporter ATP-binding protein [Metallosphaera tengchongensis]QKR00581.1 ABC transporter ATP-binding protein [Metallosphaera tengchongensis]